MSAPQGLQQGRQIAFYKRKMHHVGAEMAFRRNHDVHGGHLSLAQAEKFPQHPFDAIAFHRVAAFASYGKPQTSGTG